MRKRELSYFQASRLALWFGNLNCRSISGILIVMILDAIYNFLCHFHFESIPTGFGKLSVHKMPKDRMSRTFKFPAKTNIYHHTMKSEKLYLQVINY